jgi:hypothetical protein
MTMTCWFGCSQIGDHYTDDDQADAENLARLELDGSSKGLALWQF